MIRTLVDFGAVVAVAYLAARAIEAYFLYCFRAERKRRER
jgi:hypothetical protein